MEYAVVGVICCSYAIICVVAFESGRLSVGSGDVEDYQEEEERGEAGKEWKAHGLLL